MLYLELATVLALILVNGLLAMAELAIVSSRRNRLQALVNRDVVGSRRALALAADPGKFLSTVQIGITLIGILSGAFSGATLGLRLTAWFVSLGVPAGLAEAAGVGLIVALITYASLIIGELVPKQIALRNPEGVAVRVAPAMTILARATSPLVFLLDYSGRVVLRMLRYTPQPEGRVTDEEIRTVIAEAETAGVIEPEERTMIAGVLRLGDRHVRAIMTPRTDVDMINLADDPAVIRRAILQSIHSRLPVQDGEREAIVGIIQAKDLLDAYMRGENCDPRAYVRQAPVVPDTADALDVIEAIKNSAVHLALIFDEYGHFKGMVTNSDVLEAIVGSFRTDEPVAEPAAVQREDGSWLLSGSMSVDEFAELLGISLPMDRTYHTSGGFVVAELGRLAQVGDTVERMGWRFEVVDVDGRRTDKILATRIARPSRRAAI